MLWLADNLYSREERNGNKLRTNDGSCECNGAIILDLVISKIEHHELLIYGKHLRQSLASALPDMVRGRVQYVCVIRISEREAHKPWGTLHKIPLSVCNPVLVRFVFPQRSSQCSRAITADACAVMLALRP